MNEKTVHIPGINCGHCVANIKREVAEIKGVSSVEGDPTSKNVTIEWDAPADWDQIKATLAEIGYPPKD
jgi:copper chaperone